MRRDVFTPDHEAFRLLVREFVEREVVPSYAGWEQAGELPRKFFRQLGAHARQDRLQGPGHRRTVVLRRAGAGRQPAGAEGEAFRYLRHNLVQERMTIAVGSVTQARAALDATVEYVSARKVFGTTVGSFQNTKFELAAVAAEIEAGQALLDAAIRAHADGRLDGVDAAKTKLFCTEMQGRVVDRCLQLFGGYGYITEFPIARLYADARVTRIYGGTSEVMKLIISKSLGL